MDLLTNTTLLVLVGFGAAGFAVAVLKLRAQKSTWSEVELPDASDKSRS